MNKIRVTMRNNADARRVDGRLLGGCPAKHNGGKVVILNAADVATATAELDEDSRVVSYAVSVEATNGETLTLDEWLTAAGGIGDRDASVLCAAWRAGEDPADYAIEASS